MPEKDSWIVYHSYTGVIMDTSIEYHVLSLIFLRPKHSKPLARVFEAKAQKMNLKPLKIEP